MKTVYLKTLSYVGFILVIAVKWCFDLLQLGQEGKVPLKSARLFFDLSEKVKKVLESHFRLDTPLYFSYSHLVCRSAIDGKSGRDVFLVLCLWNSPSIAAYSKYSIPGFSPSDDVEVVDWYFLLALS